MTEDKETYTREELERLVDYIIMSDYCSPGEIIGFRTYRIRDIYVSADVVKRALEERLEKLLL